MIPFVVIDLVLWIVANYEFAKWIMTKINERFGWDNPTSLVMRNIYFVLAFVMALIIGRLFHNAFSQDPSFYYVVQAAFPVFTGIGFLFAHMKLRG